MSGELLCPLRTARVRFCRRQVRRQVAALRESLTGFLEETAGSGHVVYEGLRGDKYVFRLVMREREYISLVAEDFRRRCACGMGCDPVQNVLETAWSVRVQIPREVHMES